MKRGLLSLFALTLSFAFACRPQPATNGNGKGNANASATAECDRLPIIYSVVVTVGTKPLKDKYYFSIAPYEVTLSVKCKDQIRWIVSNPAKDFELKNIQITNFERSKLPYADPFGAGPSKFEVKYVAPQRIGDTTSGIGVNYGEYKYDVSGLLSSGESTATLTLDPRVVVGD